MIDRDFRLAIGANQLLGVQSTLSPKTKLANLNKSTGNIAEHSVKQRDQYLQLPSFKYALLPLGHQKLDSKVDPLRTMIG
jgi:hypothetical protein